MADDNIDKALPNVEQTIKVPGEEEIAAAETEVTEDRVPSPDDVEVTTTEVETTEETTTDVTE